MIVRLYIAIGWTVLFLVGVTLGIAQQVPYGLNYPNIPISSHDRVYHADQTSNTVSVYDPSTNTLLCVISLGGVTPQNLSPLYYSQSLVHRMGFSFEHKTLDVASIGSNPDT